MPFISNKKIEISSADQYLVAITNKVVMDKLIEIFGEEAILKEISGIPTLSSGRYIVEIFMNTQKPTPHPTTLRQGESADDGTSH
jgi:hypothetical protein